MSIVLLILKIIGLILAVIIGLILLLILLALFVPVRYRMRAYKDGEWHARAHVWYLFPFLLMKIWYEGTQLHYSLRIFGIRFFTEEGFRFHLPKRKKKVSKPVEETPDEPVEEIPDEPAEEVPEKPREMIHEETPEKPLELIHEETPTDSEPIKKESLLARIRKKWLAIKNIFVNIKKKIKEVMAFLRNPSMHLAFGVAKDSLIELMVYVLPTHIQGNLRIGLSDPCDTAWLTGLLSILYAKTYGKFLVIPEFEEQIWEGEVSGRGRIRLIRLVRIFIRLWRNPDITNIRKQFRNRS